ncbi:MAG: hypothetical protein AAFU79_07930 [Myxococcota bacterium]
MKNKEVVVALTFVFALALGPSAALARNEGSPERVVKGPHPVLVAAAARRVEARKTLQALRARRDLTEVAPAELPRVSRAIRTEAPFSTVAPVKVEPTEPCPLAPAKDGEGVVCLANEGVLAPPAG